MPQSGRYTRQTGANEQKKQMAPAQMRVIDACGEWDSDLLEVRRPARVVYPGVAMATPLSQLQTPQKTITTTAPLF